MSNFTVNGVYSYSSANIYSYLGRVPSSSTKLEQAFDEFNITPTGKTDDLKKLDKAMYAEYSEQVQNQIENQKGEKVVPWASLCAQIGVKATGDYAKDAKIKEKLKSQLLKWVKQNYPDYADVHAYWD